MEPPARTQHQLDSLDSLDSFDAIGASLALIGFLEQHFAAVNAAIRQRILDLCASAGPLQAREDDGPRADDGHQRQPPQALPFHQ